MIVDLTPAQVAQWMRETMVCYTLAADGVTPVRCEDPMAWSRWFDAQGGARLGVPAPIALVGDDIIVDTPRVRVTTQFTGLDDIGMDPPRLWETGVFGSPLDGARERYTSHGDAVAGHHAMCQRIRAATGATLQHGAKTP
jgi:hypothetical protein